MLGSEAVVHLLAGHGVTHIFGLCGDTSLELYRALRDVKHGMRHILTRDERSASYMADAYAKVSGKVGVCEGPSGGGATYLLPGVAEANGGSTALLALTTDISVAGRGRFTLTDLDQEALFRPLTKWNRRIDLPGQIPPTLRDAFRYATSGNPGAVHVGLPMDVLSGEVAESEVYAEPRFGSFPAVRQAPAEEEVEAAAGLLAESRHPVLVVGGGVHISGAHGELRRLAELLGAPVATSISGKHSLPDGHPLALGTVGSNGGSPFAAKVVSEADLVVFIGFRAGSVSTQKWQVPPRNRKTIIHIDADPEVVGVNYKTHAAVIGDARLALGRLNERLEEILPAKPKRRPRADELRRYKEAFLTELEPLFRSDETPIRPERLVRELGALLPEGSVLLADPGTPCPYFAAYLTSERAERSFLTPRTHGALGYALPAVVGSYFAKPDVKHVAVMGDGSFAMAAGELETIKRLGLPVTLVVVSNGSFGWIKAGQKYGYDSQYYSVDFSPTDHARVAQAFGIKSYRVEAPGKLRSTLKKALAAGEPTLVDVICQPLEEARAPVAEWVA